MPILPWPMRRGPIVDRAATSIAKRQVHEQLMSRPLRCAKET